MAERDVRVNLQADYTGEAAINRAKTDLREVDDAAREAKGGMEEASSGFDKLAVAGAAAGAGFALVEAGFDKVGDAIRGTVELVKRGAGLQDLAEDFEAVAAAAGMAGDALKRDIVEASGGLITQAEAMSAASELLNLNLGLTHDQIVNLIGMSSELGVSLEAVTTAINTQSTRGLKELGLGIDDVQARVEALTDAGKELPEAFAAATIEAMADKLAIFGTTSETAEGAMIQLSTTIAEVKDSAALAAVSLFEMAGGVDAVRNAATNLQIFQEALNLLGEADKAGIDTGGLIWNIINGDWEGVGQQMTSIQAQLDLQAISWEGWAFAVRNGIYETGTASVNIGAADKALILQAEHAMDARRALIGYAEAAMEAAMRGEEMSKVDMAAFAEQAAQMETAAAAAELYAQYTGEITSRAGDYFTAAENNGQITWDFNQALYDTADAADAPLGALKDLATQYGLMTPDLAQAAQDAAQMQLIMDTVAQAAATGIIPWEDYAAAVEKAWDALKNGPAAINEGVAAREMPSPEERGYRADWMEDFIPGGGKGYELPPPDVTRFESVVETAMNTAKGSVDGFLNPEEAYTLFLEADTSDVQGKIGTLQTLLGDLPDYKKVTVDIEVVGFDALQDLVNVVGQ